MTISDQQFLDWQRADATARTLLVEVVPYVGAPGSAVPTTRYLSNRGFVTGPADTPANVCYEDRITATPAFSIRMNDLLLGKSTVSWGDLELFNGDGGLDAWLADGWDGIAVRFYLGDGTWAKSDFRLVANLTASALTARNSTTLALRLNDFQRWLDVPLTTELMGIGPNANQPKPVAYGFCRNITPVCENTVTLKYRLNAFEVQVIDDVRDNGVSVAFTPSLGDGSFTLASAPVGLVTADISSGGRSFQSGSMSGIVYVRDKSSATAQLFWDFSYNLIPYSGGISFTAATRTITALSGTPFSGLTPGWNTLITGAAQRQNNGTFAVESVVGGGSAIVVSARLADEPTNLSATIYTGGTGEITVNKGTKSLWAGYLMRRIIERHTVIPPSQIATTQYDLNAEVGYYTTNGSLVSDALNKLATAAAGFFAFDESGILYMGLAKDPATLTAAIDLGADDVELQTMRVVRDIPAYSGVSLRLQKNWTAMSSFAGAVTDANRALWTGDHYSTAIASANNAAKYPIAVAWESAADDVLANDWYMSNATDPWHATYDTDIKASLIALFGVHRRVYAFDTRSAPHTLRLGDAVNLTHPAYGFDAGVNALVVGIVRDFASGLTTLEVLR